MAMKWSDIKEGTPFFITEDKGVTLVNGNKRKGHNARSYVLPAGTKGKLQVIGNKRRILFPQYGYVEANPDFNINFALFRFPDLPTWGVIAHSNWPKVTLVEPVQYVDNGQTEGKTIPKAAGEEAQVHITENGYPLLVFADGFKALAGLSEFENVDTTIYSWDLMAEVTVGGMV